MDLLQNPFYVLTATQRDNRHRIMELAEERGLLSDADECRAARDTLINPRKRISAEVAWLPGVVPERAYDMLLLLEASAGKHLTNHKPASIVPVGLLSSSLSCLPNTRTYNVADKILDLLKSSEGDFTEVAKFLGIDKLKPVAQANLLAARIARLPDYTPETVAQWILTLAQVFESINTEDVQAILNEERSVSGFPKITDLSVIETEIRNRRLYYQQVIKSALENILTAKARVKAVTIILLEVEPTSESSESRWPILIETAIDSYEVRAQASLEIVEKSIETLNKELRIAAEAETPTFASMVDELIETVKDWGIIALPIQLNKKRQGLHDTASRRVGNCVRELAIHLFNEYDKLYASQQILKALKVVFDRLPEIVERITLDLETLNKIASQREHSKS